MTSFKPNYLAKALPLTSITQGVRASRYESEGEDTNIQSVAMV